MCTTTSWYKRFKFRMDGEWKIENGKIKWKIKKKNREINVFQILFLYCGIYIFSIYYRYPHFLQKLSEANKGCKTKDYSFH